MPNVLNNITSFAKGLFAKETPSVVGIDISSSAIKVVQLKRQRGKAVLETYGSVALGPYNEFSVGQSVKLSQDQLTQALKDILTEAKVTTQNAGSAIPLSSSLVTRIEVPTTKKEKLESIIPLEARKYVPVSVSEVMLDWHVIPHEEVPRSEKGSDGRGEKTEVLLVAIHNDTIRNFQNILKQAELNVSFFEIEAFSSIRSLIQPGIAPILVADLGASTTKLYIVEAGIVKASHIVNRGGQDITMMISKSLGVSFDKAEELKRLYGREKIEHEEDVARTIRSGIEFQLNEIERIILSFERTYNKPIKNVVLTGGSSSLHGLPEAAVERFSTDVAVGNPFEKTDFPAFLEDALREAGPEFAVSVGIALRKLEEKS